MRPVQIVVVVVIPTHTCFAGMHFGEGSPGPSKNLLRETPPAASQARHA
jgi:hypothetical protein